MEIRPLLSALCRSRTAPLLVAMQIAIALTVLVNVTYVVHERLAFNAQPTGIDLDNVFCVNVTSSEKNLDHPARVKEDLSYLNSLPGVTAASIISNMPQSGTSWSWTLGFSAESPSERKKTEVAAVFLGSAKILESLGLKLKAGRTFSEEAVTPPGKDGSATFERWTSEVMITDALAMKLYPAGDALGKQIYLTMNDRSAVIVGIIERMQAGPWSRPAAELANQVLLAAIVPPAPGRLYMGHVQPGRLNEIMSRVEHDLDTVHPGQFVNSVLSLAKVATHTRLEQRTTSLMLAVVAGFVLAVTALGIFGLAAFNVTTRTKQIGVRRAIGARRFHILRYFLVENWLITTAGVAVGCVTAMVVGIKLSLLYEMPRLPLYYLVGGVVLMWVMGLLAVWAPAKRASSVSPAIATRTV